MEFKGYSHPVSPVGAASPLSVKYFEICHPIWDVCFFLLLTVNSVSPLMRSRAGRQGDVKCNKMTEKSTVCQEGSTLTDSTADPPFLRLRLNTAKGGQPDLGSKYRL